MALYREFYSVGTTFRKYAEYIARNYRDFIAGRTEVRDDNALSFCPFARTRIARIGGSDIRDRSIIYRRSIY